MPQNNIINGINTVQLIQVPQPPNLTPIVNSPTSTVPINQEQQVSIIDPNTLADIGSSSEPLIIEQQPIVINHDLVSDNKKIPDKSAIPPMSSVMSIPTQPKIIDPTKLQLTSQQNQIQPSDDKLLSTFLSGFVSESFISSIINTTLYQADFSTSSTKSADVVKFIRKFLNDVQKDIRKAPNSQFTKVPKTTLQSSTRLAYQILELREDITSRLVTYDNVLQHFPKRDLYTEKLLKNVSNDRITSIDRFRSEFDTIIHIIQTYNEVDNIKPTLIALQNLMSSSESIDSSVLNMVKVYKDIIATAYNELSSLTTITKSEQLEDYMVLADPSTVGKVVNNLVSFLSSGYAFYKSGYPLIDNAIGGLESSTFHLITGPSNHAKSIFMINMLRNIIVNNPTMIGPQDTLVFITLEDKILSPLLVIIIETLL